ncbi:hypothetical protein PHSC3_001282 [Chlamydiales bacterium STE3]|nr:hypothetical protein PHSC3_001282 [Chlamydiales bacterium STE3]
MQPTQNTTNPFAQLNELMKQMEKLYALPNCVASEFDQSLASRLEVMKEECKGVKRAFKALQQPVVTEISSVKVLEHGTSKKMKHIFEVLKPVATEDFESSMATCVGHTQRVINEVRTKGKVSKLIPYRKGRYFTLIEHPNRFSFLEERMRDSSLCNEFFSTPLKIQDFTLNNDYLAMIFKEDSIVKFRAIGQVSTHLAQEHSFNDPKVLSETTKLAICEEQLAVGLKDGGILVIDLNQKKRVHLLSKSHKKNVTALLMTQEQIISAGSDRAICFFNRNSQKLKHIKAGSLTATQLAAHEQTLYSISRNGIKIWDINKEKVIKTFKPEAGPVVQLFPEKRGFYVAIKDRVTYYDQDSKARREIPRFYGDITSMTKQEDRILIGTDEGAIYQLATSYFTG